MNSKIYPVEFYTKKTWFGKTEHRWRVTADNGRIIGASTQGYSNMSDCIYNANSLGLSLTNHFE